VGANPISQALVFLVDILLGLYILAVLLRFLFQVVRADFYNPFSQALVIITNPTLKPLRRMIPGLYGVDLAAIVLMLVLQCLKNFIIGLIKGAQPKVTGLVVVAAVELLQLTLWVFIIAIFIRVILSWISPYATRQNPAVGLLNNLTEPLMRPARQMIPPMGGLDLSPIAVFILLYLTIILIVNPLLLFGRGYYRSFANHMRWCRWQDQDLILQVQIQPRASRDEFAGIVGSRLKIRITAPPVDGRANVHLINFLAKQFGVSKSAVALLQGEKAKTKVICIRSPIKIPSSLSITQPD
jgi:YggT family protein